MTQPPRPPLPYALLLPVILVVLVDVFATTLVMPVLPLYAEQLGASALGATLTISIFSACQFVSGPVLGAISDRVGRKPVLVISQLGTLGGLLLIASAGSMAQVYVGRAIDGFTAGNLSLAQALIAERTPPERRSDAFAIMVAALGVALFAGPCASAQLVRYGLAAPIYAGALLSALSIAASLALLPRGAPTPETSAAGEPGNEAPKAGEEGDKAPEAGAEGDEARQSSEAREASVIEGAERGLLASLFDWDTYGQYFRRPGLGPLLRQFALYTFALASFLSGVAIFAVRSFRWGDEPFGAREVGYLFAYGGLLGIVTQGLLMPRLTRRFGDQAVVRAGFAAFALGQFGLGYARSVPALVAAVTVGAFGMNALRPSLTSLITKQVTSREQGVVLGVAQSLESLMAIAAPFVGGLLLDRGLTAIWAWFTGAVALLGLAVARSGRTPAAPTASPRPDDEPPTPETA